MNRTKPDLLDEKEYDKLLECMGVDINPTDPMIRMRTVILDMITAKDFLSPFPEDYPKHIPKWIVTQADAQHEKLMEWCRLLCDIKTEFSTGRKREPNNK